MSCVPCPCDLFKITNPIQCAAVNTTFTDPPRLGQLYSGLYSAATYVPEIIEGIPQIIQSDLTSWGVKLGLAVVLPWLIMFIILFIIMAGQGLITYGVALILAILVIALTIISLIFIYYETKTLVVNFGPQVQEKLSSNWDEKKEDIVPEILNSYLDCSYCNSSIFGCTASCGGVCNACGRT
jgi:hypothetical protein